MNTRFVVTHSFRVLLVSLALVLSGTTLTLAHDSTSGRSILSKGRILLVEQESVVFVLGSRTPRVGEELAVFRVKTGRGSQVPALRRVREGTVKVVEILEDGTARAELLDGRARARWIVDQRPHHRTPSAG